MLTSRSKKQSRDNVVAYIMIMPAMALIFVFLLYPLVYSLILSVMGGSILRGDTSFVGLENYMRLAKDPAFYHSFRITVLFVFVSIFLQFGIGLAMALTLDAELLYGRAIGKTIITLPFVVSPLAIGMIWRWILAPEYGAMTGLLYVLGLRSIPWLSDSTMALWSAIMVNTWRSTPFAMLVLVAGLQVVDRQLYEAARIDGASAIVQFFYLTIPQIKPSIMIVLLFLTLENFNMFDIIYGLTGGGPGAATRTLALNVYYIAFRRFNFSYASSIAVVLLLFNLAFGVFYGRKFAHDD